MTGGLETTLYDVLGGATVALGTSVYSAARRRLQAFHFKQVFGPDADAGSEHHIVYGMLHLSDPVYNARGEVEPHPYRKLGTDKVFRIAAPVSLADMRAASYLSEAFGESSGLSAKLTSDDELRDKLDVSFCSLGGFNNWKTIDVLENPANGFLTFDAPGGHGIVPKRGTAGAFLPDAQDDYGTILKVRPEAFPHRVWIAVAGLGEWGTSGAAWYLATHWSRIARRAGRRPFALVLKVRKGRDESAEVVFADFRPVRPEKPNPVAV